MDTYYSVLGVKASADEREINRAYRQKIRLVHPDINKRSDAHVHSQLLNEAYAILSHTEKRAEYDSWLRRFAGDPYTHDGREANIHQDQSREYVAGPWGRRRPDWSTDSQTRSNSNFSSNGKTASSNTTSNTTGNYRYSNARVEPEPPSITLPELWLYFRREVLCWLSVVLAGVVIAYFEIEILALVLLSGLVGFYLIAKLGFLRSYAFVFNVLISYVAGVGCLVLLILIPVIIVWDYLS